jgi:Fe-S oxidoreductase
MAIVGGLLGFVRRYLIKPSRLDTKPDNHLIYKMLVEANIETMNRYHIRKILTTCPHCFNNFKNEYPPFGGRFEVVHQTEF